ncbi:hypothetical protein AAMO2058_000576800 [Amorphochlora amoebiformis]
MLYARLLVLWLVIFVIHAVGRDEDPPPGSLNAQESENSTQIDLPAPTKPEPIATLEQAQPKPEQIKAKEERPGRFAPENNNLIWYFVVVLGFGIIAIRNRKQVASLSNMAKPGYHKLASAVDSARTIPMSVYSKVSIYLPNFSRSGASGEGGVDGTSRIPKIRAAVAKFLSYLPTSLPFSRTVSNGEALLGRKCSDSDIELVPMTYEYTPQLLNYRISPILSKPVAKELVQYVPPALQMDDLKLLYSSNEHGALLSTLFDKATGQGPAILIVKDESNAVFGAFSPESWRRGSFGNGQSFVFTVSPQVEIYKWDRGRNTHFFNASHNHIGIGGPKAAIWLDSKLRSGLTEDCNTFLSPPLSKSCNFDCYGVELWGFVIPESVLPSSYR